MSLFNFISFAFLRKVKLKLHQTFFLEFRPYSLNTKKKHFYLKAVLKFTFSRITMYLFTLKTLMSQ